MNSTIVWLLFSTVSARVLVREWLLNTRRPFSITTTRRAGMKPFASVCHHVNSSKLFQIMHHCCCNTCCLLVFVSVSQSVTFDALMPSIRQEEGRRTSLIYPYSTAFLEHSGPN